MAAANEDDPRAREFELLLENQKLKHSLARAHRALEARGEDPPPRDALTEDLVVEQAKANASIARPTRPPS